jgi:CMP/dCMP kinase
MAIITLSRQFGAGGVPVGRALAERLGMTFLDRDVVALVAARSGIPVEEAEGYDERLPGPWHRIAAALATSSPEVALPPLPAEMIPGGGVEDRLAALTRLVIEEAGARGNTVVVGRGGGWILGARPDVLRVQLHASLDARLRMLASQTEEIPPDTRPDEASLRDLARSVDRARSRYLRRRFDVDWNDIRHYDLALDTGRLGVEHATDLIESAARRQFDLPR